MRYLYSFLFYCILPFVFLRMLWRSFRLPAYRERMQERLGYYPFKLEKCLWVHAVSVGETIAALPLIKELKNRYPTYPMLITTMTPTGAARVKLALGDTVHHVYIPYDVPGAVNRFLKAMNPIAGVIMETELWPNMITACFKKHVPICVVNARLSEKSWQGYHRLGYLVKEMLGRITHIAANGEPDAKRFLNLGAPSERVTITGNIKFDLNLPENLEENRKALRQELGNDRFIWIAASTHEGEEQMVLKAHKKIREKNPNALLLLVPRHPDRFESVAKLAEQYFKIKKRSDKNTVTDFQVYLGDTMGEMLLMYSIADVAFVGGSLIPRGGHNMLEPAALQKPILTGPHVFNFAEISEMLFSAKAMIKVNDESTLAEQVIYLMQNKESAHDMGKHALEVMNANRGALKRQLNLVSHMLDAVA